MLDAVRDAALYAAGGSADAARLVSKGEWDDARAGAGFADLPTAESIRQRLRITHWRSVLAVVFLPAESRRQAIGSYTKRVGAYGVGAALPTLLATPVERSRIEQLLATDDMDGDLPVDAEQAPALDHGPRSLPAGPSAMAVAITTRALKTVSFRLGHVPSTEEYDHEVRVLEEARRTSDLPPLGFPSSDSVAKRFGGWQAAGEVCGVEMPPAWTQPPGAQMVEVFDASIDFWGFVCSHKKLRAFAEACDISLQYRHDPWAVIMEEVRQLRAKRGAGMPPRATRAISPSLKMPTAEEAAQIRERLGDVPTRRNARRSRAEAYEGLQIYKEVHLKPGDQPLDTHYRAACRKDGRLLWPSVLKTVTGKSFTELMAEIGL